MNRYQSIDAERLLGRELNLTHTELARNFIDGKTVLVTGAGGSIGSEIVEQLVRLKAKKIVCIDRDEYALYNLDLKLNGSALLTSESLILADICDYDAIDSIIKAWKPEMIFHAAAVKHLPLLERSPKSAYATNVIGTKNVIEAAMNNRVEQFVNISTDKAADPTSVLGYSKRIAEMIASYYSSGSMMIASVRFGNVFASRGSFIETMQWQVANSREVTITDAEATRFFMSIPQAASLVIETAAMAESGNTYVLDMEEPVKILDIFNKYIEITGASATKLKFSSLRQGEKMHERLYDHRESRQTTQHGKISTVRVSGGDEDFMLNLDRFTGEIMEHEHDASRLSAKLRSLAHENENQMIQGTKLKTMELQ